MERFQRDLLSTIKMVIRATIQSIIYACLNVVNILNNTRQTQRENNNSETRSRRIEIKSTKAYERVLKIENLRNTFVILVERLLSLSPIMPRLALVSASNRLKTKGEESQRLFGHAISVGKNLKQVIIKRDVPRNVLKSGEGKSLERVYNLQVEDKPEYFANNILVHNCAIAWQLNKFVITPEQQETEDYDMQMRIRKVQQERFKLTKGANPAV